MCLLELNQISFSRLPVWDDCGWQADRSDHNTDHLRLHRCRRRSPWRRCGRLPNLIGPSGCGTFVLQRSSSQRCRARSPTETSADHWETDREQTPFLWLAIFAGYDLEKMIRLQFLCPSGMFGTWFWTAWDDQKVIFTWSCHYKHRARH